MEKDLTSWNMPENTRLEIIEKISSLAWDIRSNWSDPRSECYRITRLCNKLLDMEDVEGENKQ